MEWLIANARIPHQLRRRGRSRNGEDLSCPAWFTDRNVQPEPAKQRLVRVPGLAFPAIAKQLKPGATMHVWFQGFGHGQEITETLFVLFTREQWKEYFVGFEPQRYLMTPRFCEPWLSISQLRPNQLEFIRRTLDFPSQEIFVQWLQWAWPEYWNLVPTAQHPRFNQEFLELYPLKTSSTYQVQAVWLMVDAVRD